MLLRRALEIQNKKRVFRAAEFPMKCFGRVLSGPGVMATVEGVSRDEREELQNQNNPGKETNSVCTWEIFARISSSTLSINVPVLPSLPLPCINNLNGLFFIFSPRTRASVVVGHPGGGWRLRD